MKFTISKHALTSALYKAVGVADRKSAQNILSHVLVESIDPGHVRVTATDFDVVVIGVYPAEVIEPGRMAINAKNAHEVARTLTDAPITLTGLSNHWVDVACGSSHFKLAGLPPDDFPENVKPDGANAFKVPKRLLLGLFDRTAFSVSHDETRPSLMGVLLRMTREEGEVRLVAASTDGHRLSKAEALGGDAGTFKGPADCIVTGKAISDIKRALEGDADDVEVSMFRENLVLTCDGVTLQVRKLDEQFPDYSKVIPKPKNTWRVSRVALVSAIKRVAVLTSAKTSIIRFETGAERLLLTAQNPEMGEGRDEVPVDGSDASCAVGFNYKYVLDVLGIIAGDTINLSVNDQYSPGLITSDDDAGSMFVVMPMRV